MCYDAICIQLTILPVVLWSNFLVTPDRLQCCIVWICSHVWMTDLYMIVQCRLACRNSWHRCTTPELRCFLDSTLLFIGHVPRTSVVFPTQGNLEKCGPVTCSCSTHVQIVLVWVLLSCSLDLRSMEVSLCCIIHHPPYNTDSGHLWDSRLSIFPTILL